MKKSNYLTAEEVEDTVREAVEPTKNMLIVVVLALGVAFITLLVTVAAMVVDVFQSRTDATNQLTQSVNTLGSRLA
jgi:hypothetical protein